MSQHVMEIVRFSPVPGAVPVGLVEAAREAGTWLKAQPGLVGRSLGRSDDEIWVDWVEWTDMASAKAAAGQIMDIPATAAFFSMIDMSIVDVRHCVIDLAI